MHAAPQPSQVRYTVDPRDVPPIKAARRLPKYLVLMRGKWRFKPSAAMQDAGFSFLTLGIGTEVDGKPFPTPAQIERAEQINEQWRICRAAGSGRAELTPRTGGYIYFLVTARFVKIGFSTQPFGRASALKTGLAEEMAAFIIVKGTRSDERRLHDAFAGARVRGEWFALNSKLKDAIAEAAAGRVAKLGDL